MEPSNTSRSTSTAWASPAAFVDVEHRDPSLLSPAFSPAPSPGLVPASGSGSESSWYEQIPHSPAVAAGNGSPSVNNAHTLQFVPSSSFPITDGTLPMVGYDLFGSREATVATPLPTLFGGQWQQGESSSWAAAPVLPECPSPGSFGFAAEFAAWPASEDTSSFFSPSSDGGLAPQSSDDNLVGFAEPSADSVELEALLESFRTPSLAVEESPVDAPMPPVEEEEEEDEEEEMDVSAFLVSDPEDQLPDASWTDSPQMVGSGGGATASWMAPGNTGNNWPPMLAPAAASTCTMVSTSSGSGGGASASWMGPGNTDNNWPPMLAPAAFSTCTMVSTSSASMACHSGSSSIGVASSIVGPMTMMKPSSSVLPLVPSSSQGAGASSSNFNGFAQPSLSYVLAPHAPPNLQGPLLPVKQEIMDVDATPRRHPDFISLDDDDKEEGFYQDAMPMFGSWGSSSSWPGSSNGNPSFASGSWGGGDGGSSSSPSFAPGSWGSSGVSPGFAPSNWGGGGGSSSPSFAPGNNWGDGSSSSSSPSFAPSSWGGGGGNSPSFDQSTPCFDESMSMDDFMQELSTRGRMASIPGLPPLPKSDVRAISSSNGGTGNVFTHHEMAIIAKDRKLQELLKTDIKKLKRVLYNRAYSAAAKVRKVMHTKNLERMIATLQERRRALREELQSLQEGSAVLKAQQMEIQMIIGELEKQTMLKDVVKEALRADIQNLKNLKLN